MYPGATRRIIVGANLVGRRGKSNRGGELGAEVEGWKRVTSETRPRTLGAVSNVRERAALN